MESDWKDQTVVEAYAQAMWPYGDAWRMALINPVILETAKRMCSQMAPHNAAEHLPIDDLPLDLGLVLQREALKCSSWESPQATHESLSSWHRTLAPGGYLSLKGLNILDLGCGEGHLARILTKLEATYLGIDVSQGLLNIAESGGWDPWVKHGRRTVAAAKVPPKISKTRKPFGSLFACADLDGPALAPSVNAIQHQLSQLGTPNLVVMTIVSDHLQDPGPVYSWVSRTLAAQPGERLFLLFALNHDYFDLDQLRNANSASRVVSSRFDAGDRITYFNACIHSAQQPVGVHIRSKRIIERHLRDARFRVVQSMPLYFWYGFSCDKQPANVRGIPPFIAFLARPLPTSSASRAQIKTLLESQWSPKADGLLNKLSQAQKDLLLGQTDQVEIVAFEPAQVAIGQHSLGGDLFVVLEGKLDLAVNGKPLLSGGPGQIFGELETGPQGRVAHYPYPVAAGDTGAKVLRIPASLAQHLTDKETTFGMSLFRQLRDRLVVWNWTNAPRTNPATEVKEHDSFNDELGIEEKPSSRCFEVISLYADRAARVLLAAAEQERQCGKRDSEGRCILLDCQKFLDRLRLQRANLQELSLVLRKMTALGIVDALPGDDLRKYFKLECNERWNHLVEESGRTFFEPFCKYAPPNTISPEAVFWGLVRDLRASDDIPSWQYAQTSQHTGMSEIKVQLTIRQHLLKMAAQKPTAQTHAEWHQLVKQWHLYLWNVNRLFFGGRPNFYVIHDPTMLRRLVLDTGRAVNYQAILRHRALTAISDPFEFEKKGGADFSDIVSSFQEKKEAKSPGRATFYLQRLSEFCLNDLRSFKGQLAFSGSTESFPPPVSWDT